MRKNEGSAIAMKSGFQNGARMDKRMVDPSFCKSSSLDDPVSVVKERNEKLFPVLHAFEQCSKVIAGLLRRTDMPLGVFFLPFHHAICSEKCIELLNFLELRSGRFQDEWMFEDVHQIVDGTIRLQFV